MGLKAKVSSSDGFVVCNRSTVSLQGYWLHGRPGGETGTDAIDEHTPVGVAAD